MVITPRLLEVLHNRDIPWVCLYLHKDMPLQYCPTFALKVENRSEKERLAKKNVEEKQGIEKKKNN
jgi:hypothetical protein